MAIDESKALVACPNVAVLASDNVTLNMHPTSGITLPNGTTALNVNIAAGGSGGSGSTGSVTAPGTTGTQAQAVQGVTGGVPLPVSGNFYQATQPVSISGNVPVTGTFWQTTQPVSNTVLSNLQLDANNYLKVNIAAGTSTGSVTAAGTSGSQAQAMQGITGGVPVAVSGTFFQATQPISGTVTANVQGGNTTAVKVDGSAVTQPVSIAGTVAVSGPFGSSTAAGTSGTVAQAVQGITGGVALPVTLPAIGIGISTAMPTASATAPPPLGTIPTGAIGFRLYLGAGASVSGVFATSQTNANNSVSLAATYSNSGNNNPIVADDNVAAGVNFYVTAATGTTTFRWM